MIVALLELLSWIPGVIVGLAVWKFLERHTGIFK
jgi:hypothetical protein